MQRLLRLFSRAPAQPATAAATPALPGIPMIWRDDATMPIPDWRAMWTNAPAADIEGALDDYYGAAARQWLDALRESLGGDFCVAESAHFLLLSDVDPRQRRLTLEHCERTRRRILAALPDITASTGYGPHVAFVFADIDQYYHYVSHYYPEQGEFAMSSGMFIQHGYGHFVFVAAELSRTEPVIAHELTHCLVMHLRLPAWLNEGIAVSTEKRLNPLHHRAGQGLYSEREMAMKHAAFWNAETIQQFWSGKSFLRSDDGNLLSYDLGERLTRLAATDYMAFAEFANTAKRDDAGASAAQKTLGVSLHSLASAVLGEGPWTPRPDTWHDGTEAGQFVERDD